MSARSPMARGLLPTRMVPTTPVLPMPVVTSQPHSLSLVATIFDVRSSSKPSSGWAWMSRRMAVSSAVAAAILGSIFMWLSGLQKEGRHYTTKLGAMHVRILMAAVRQGIGAGAADDAHAQRTTRVQKLRFETATTSGRVSWQRLTANSGVASAYIQWLWVE